MSARFHFDEREYLINWIVRDAVDFEVTPDTHVRRNDRVPGCEKVILRDLFTRSPGLKMPGEGRINRGPPWPRKEREETTPESEEE